MRLKDHIHRYHPEIPECGDNIFSVLLGNIKNQLSPGFEPTRQREWTGDQLYKTRQAAIADVREYVAAHYNSKRLQSTLSYKIPMNYEKDLNKVSGIT